MMLLIQHSVSLLCDLDQFQSSVELKRLRHIGVYGWRRAKRERIWKEDSISSKDSLLLHNRAINFYYLLSLASVKHCGGDKMMMEMARKTQWMRERNWHRTIINADDFRNPYDYHVWVLIIIYIARLPLNSFIALCIVVVDERRQTARKGCARIILAGCAHCVPKLIQIKHKFVHYIKAIFHCFRAALSSSSSSAICCHFSLQ